jgi:hypothetical protein
MYRQAKAKNGAADNSANSGNDTWASSGNDTAWGNENFGTSTNTSTSGNRM